MIVYKVWSEAPEEAEWKKLDLKNSKEIITELLDAAYFYNGEENPEGVPVLKYYRTKAEALKKYRSLLKNKPLPIDYDIQEQKQIIDDQYKDDEDEDEDDEGPYQWRNAVKSGLIPSHKKETDK